MRDIVLGDGSGKCFGSLNDLDILIVFVQGERFYEAGIDKIYRAGERTC